MPPSGASSPTFPTAAPNGSGEGCSLDKAKDGDAASAFCRRREGSGRQKMKAGKRKSPKKHLPTNANASRKTRRRYPLINRNDSKIKIAMAKGAVFVVEGLLLFIGLFLSIPIVKISLNLIARYLPKDSFAAASCAVLTWFLLMSAWQKYIGVPLSFRIENFVGVRGATNLKNPNKDLL